MAFSLLLDENFNSTFSKDDFEDVLSFISSADNNVNGNMQVIRDDHNAWSRAFGLNNAQTMHTGFCDNQQNNFAEMNNLAHYQQDASPLLQSFASFGLEPKTTATNNYQQQNDKMSFSTLRTSSRPNDTRECSTSSSTKSGDSQNLIDVSSILHTTNDFIHSESQVKDSSLDLPYEPLQSLPHLCNQNNRNTTTSMLSSDTMHTLPNISKQQDIFSPIIQSLNNDILNKCSLVSLLESIRNKVQKDHATSVDGFNKDINIPSISIDYSESPPSSLPQIFVQNTSECPSTNMLSVQSSSSYQPSFSNNEFTTMISQCSNNNDVSSSPLLEPPVATEYGYDSNDMLLPLSAELIESEEMSNKSQQQNEVRVGPYTCPEDKCLEVFKSKQGLNLHKLKKHNIGKLYKCNECEFKTPRRKDLHGHLVSQHKKLMPGMKVYECKFCSYKCVDKQRLLEHEVIHTGIKQFSCPDCAKHYTTKRGLRTHFKFHSSDRPHKCNLCDADFKVKSKLTDHLKLVHYKKGEKPFLCGYCDHKASIRGNVNQHIRNIHKGKPIIVLVSGEKKSKRTKKYSYTTVDRSAEKSMK